jgi:hypothetical protein
MRDLYGIAKPENAAPLESSASAPEKHEKEVSSQTISNISNDQGNNMESRDSNSNQ